MADGLSARSPCVAAARVGDAVVAEAAQQLGEAAGEAVGRHRITD
jgi:hypothetical protein